MNNLTRKRNAPFSVIAGQGLGSLYGETAFGSAGIQSIVNAATGNVCVRDRVLKYPDIGSAVEFSYVYNSLSSGSGWNLAFARTIKSVVPNQKLVVTELDGRSIDYTFDREKNAYVADQADDGRPSIMLDKASGNFKWHHPHTHVTEYFDQNQKITKRVDKDGNATTFEYHGDGKLKAIIPPSGIRYEFEYIENEIKVFINDQGKALLHTYVLDKNGALTKSKTCDSYEIDYSCNEQNKLESISQSDQSTLKLEYYCDGEHQGKINKITAGDQPEHSHHFNYKDSITEIADPASRITAITLDEKQNSVNLNSGNDNKKFFWNKQNQIEKIVYADKSFESYEYDENGLLTRFTRCDRSSIKYVYSNEKPYVLLQKLEYSPKLSLPITRHDYVYDKSCMDGHPILRFVVTGEGSVKEYERNENGQIKRKREYIKDKLTRNSELVMLLSLDEVNAWRESVVTNAGLKNTSLTEYQYDQNDSIEKTIQYASVLPSGDGNLEDNVVTIQHPMQVLAGKFSYL